MHSLGISISHTLVLVSKIKRFKKLSEQIDSELGFVPGFCVYDTAHLSLAVITS